MKGRAAPPDGGVSLAAGDSVGFEINLKYLMFDRGANLR